MTAEESHEHPWLRGAGDDLTAVREGRVPGMPEEVIAELNAENEVGC